ncbi:MAG: aminotransferase class IV, partial [Nitrospirota bacterium]
MRKVWFNGLIIPESEAKLSIYDSALMYGDVVFEMFRSFNQKIFKFNEHLERLEMSCKILEIDIDFWDCMIPYCEELLNNNEWQKDDEIRGLINISRGILPMYAEAGMGKSEPNIIMACFPLKYVLKGKSNVYTEGVDVVVPYQRAIPEQF